MIYFLLGMSLLFVAIGFIVTERNAKYTLSGYNLMSEEARKRIDIKSYLSFFRKFHVFLGVTLLILGAALTYLINENVGLIFLVIYPILAYTYLLIASSKYSKGSSALWNKVVIFIMIGTLLFVVGLLGYGFKENKLVFDAQRIEIKRIYGETLSQNQIESIELVNQLPNITYKTNGFALGSIKKGYFKTENGEMVKLILNSDNKPYILFVKSDGKKIYYSAKKAPNEMIFNQMKQTLTDIVYK